MVGRFFRDAANQIHSLDALSLYPHVVGRFFRAVKATAWLRIDMS